MSDNFLLAQPSRQPIRVVRIIARLNMGGPARHVVWLTAGLQEPGYRSLLVAGTVPQGEDDMSYFAEQAGVAPFYIPEMSREISLKDVATIWKLYRLFLRERPDIVHTHTAKAGTVGRVAGFIYRWFTLNLLLGRPRKCKFVHTYHGHIFHSYYGRTTTKIFIAIERLLAWLITDRIIVISEQQGFEIRDKFRVGKSGQIKVIPLGLDLQPFAGNPPVGNSARRRRFRTELGIEDGTTLVGIVGRLTEIKNHQMFLESVARFKRISSDVQVPGAVRFVIIGDGSLRKELEHRTRLLGLGEDVIFTGARKDPEYFYPALDVVALTSRNEGTPLTVIEAMANGLPVVATSVGGVVDLLGESVAPGKYQICQRGISVPADDQEAFAEALTRIVGEPTLRRELGERGLEFVHRNYRKDRLLDDIRNLYDDLIQNTTRPSVSGKSQNNKELEDCEYLSQAEQGSSAPT